MKKIAIVLFVISFAYSCDKSGSISYYIANDVSSAGTINYYFTFDKDTIIDLPANSKVSISNNSGLGISEPAFTTNNDDSVVVHFDNGKSIKFFIDSVNNGKKTIYKEDYWIINEVSKRSFECTFRITNDDLND